MNQETCTECGTTTGVKKDGNLWRHKNPEGFYCDNVSTESSEGQHHEAEAAPLVFSAETTTDAPASLSVDVAGEDSPKRPRKATASPKKTFTFTMEVVASCPFVGNKNWESGNKSLAYKKAKDAGEKPTGEPQLTYSEIEGNKRVLRYEVPIE